MKRRMILYLVIAVILGMSACGNEAQSKATVEKSTQEILETETLNKESQQETSETEILSEEVLQDIAETEERVTGQNTEATEIETICDDMRFIRVIYDADSNPDDSGRNYYYHYEVPSIEIPENRTVQEKIQADLDELVNEFLQAADEDNLYESDEESDQRYLYMSIYIERMDKDVISIGCYEEGSGGAHGWHQSNYLNYFTKSGEKVTFEKLGTNFREKAIELVGKKATEMQQENEIFFDDYETYVPLAVCDGTEKKSDIYREVYGTDSDDEEGNMQATFFITADGFVFISNEYVMQPYASGAVDFEIPKEDFGDSLTVDIFSK